MQLGRLVGRRAEMKAGWTLEAVQNASAREIAEARAAFMEHAGRTGYGPLQREAGTLRARYPDAGPPRGADAAQRDEWPLGRRRLDDITEQADLIRAEDADLQAAIARWGHVQSGRSPQALSALAKLRDEYANTLAEIRPMGGTLIMHPLTSPDALSAFRSAAQHFPSSWLDASRQSKAPVGKLTSDRASYTRMAEHEHNGRTIHAPLILASPTQFGPILPGAHDRDRSALHELGHRMQHVVPGIQGFEHDHLLRRTTKPDGTREPLVRPLLRAEYSYQDSFADTYQGRDYTPNSMRDARKDAAQVQRDSRRYGTEILSTGMEGLFGGSYGGFSGAGRYKADRESRDFILGLLAAAP